MQGSKKKTDTELIGTETSSYSTNQILFGYTHRLTKYDGKPNSPYSHQGPTINKSKPTDRCSRRLHRLQSRRLRANPYLRCTRILQSWRRGRPRRRISLVLSYSDYCTSPFSAACAPLGSASSQHAAGLRAGRTAPLNGCVKENMPSKRR